MPAPLTPFELSGRTTYTPLEAEQDYVDSLLAYAGGTLGYEVVGASVSGNPMRMFTIGTGPIYVMWTGQMHGNEPISREVLYTTLRTWVDSTDPDLLDYLTKVTVVIMPTCQPDTLTSRNTLGGVNPNRDFINMTQPEVRAIAGVTRRFQPDLVVDWHEYFGSESNPIWYQTRPALNINAHQDLVGLATLCYQLVKDEIAGMGYQVADYNIMHGPHWHMNNALLQGCCTMLMETKVYEAPAIRHDMHLAALDVIWRWHHENLSEVRSAVEAARQSTTPPAGPVKLEYETGGAGPTVGPLPYGYFLTRKQYRRVAQNLWLMGIKSHAVPGGMVVPLHQGRWALATYLLHPESPLGYGIGLPVTQEQAAATTSPIRAPLGYTLHDGSTTHQIDTLIYQRDE